MKYDVIIVGAGGAGYSCGIQLQRLRISSCIIDNVTYPKEKLRGNVLTRKAYDLLKTIIPEEDIHNAGFKIEQVTNVSIFDKGIFLNRATVDIPFFILDREKFDNHLRECYELLGGEVIEGDSIQSVEFDTKQLIIDGNTYSYEYLVMADGVLRKIHKEIGLKLSKLGFCIETEILKDDVLSFDEIRINFNIIENGYAYIIPYGKYFKVGLYGEFDESISYSAEFKSYLHMLGVHDITSYDIKRSYVPFIDCPRKLVYKNVCFIGNAGGLINPITGEGLYFALNSGIHMAKCISENKTMRMSFIDDYARPIKLDKLMVKYGNIYKYLLYSKATQKLIFQCIERKKGFLKYFLDEQVSSYRRAYKRLPLLLFDYILQH